MNNYEWIKTQSVRELGHELCDMMEDRGSCNNCPVSDKCDYGSNGFITWLEEEHETK